MLPKFHKKRGYDVEVIASTQSFDSNGKVCYLDKTGTYQNEYDIKVTRLPYKSSSKVWKKLKRYVGTEKALEEANPDILFIHGCQFLDIDKIVNYLKKHNDVVTYVDNHADFSNSATNWISKNVLHKIIWKNCAHQIEPYVRKFYGVLPIRVEFLTDIYKLPANKCELLVMGADDDLVEKAKKTNARQYIRKKYGIKEDDFLVLTGGKIDRWKTQTLLLMKAVQKIDKEKLKLIVFGSVIQELRDQVINLVDGDKIKYIGWVDAKNSYDYFEAADLVVFPGRHSVMWEQVTGQGIPMIVKSWPGTHHVDLGGNVRFLYTDSVEEIQKEIELLISNVDDYRHMKTVAEQNGMNVFSYKKIAEKAINLSGKDNDR
ncbi:MAG: glycosyltransferase family 4 protein [Erysipelotrichaceae bacterium]|nr:glycosyltransferase family 4 protein [Erysipelotrichaceae bacterium]